MYMGGGVSQWENQERGGKVGGMEDGRNGEGVGEAVRRKGWVVDFALFKNRLWLAYRYRD